MKKEWRVIIIGPSGSGKGTQARLLGRKLGVPPLSTGELLRKEADKKTPLGISVANYINRGHFVPVAILTKVVLAELQKRKYERGFILDGALRRLAEAPILEEFLSRRDKKIDRVIHLDTSDQTCQKRIAGRRSARADDTPEAIRQRLNEYHQRVKPVLDYFAQKGILLRADNEPPVKEVFAQIWKRIKKETT